MWWPKSSSSRTPEEHSREGRNAAAALLLLGLLTAPFPTQSATHPVQGAPLQLDPKAASKLLIHQVVPKYPAIAKANYIWGRVRLKVSVEGSGRVSAVHVLAGHPLLAAAALDAVRRWTYRPLATPSGATGFQTIVDVNFVLRDVKVEHLPREPERDLARQVRPPELLTPLAEPSPGASVRLRVLVGDNGRALDATPLSGRADEFALACRQLDTWKFRPARWGNLDVPWYLDVNVKVDGARPVQKP
jgi:TonB family protein